MGKKQGAALPAAGSSAPGVTSSSAAAQSGPTAAQDAPGAADARKLLAAYAKGVRPAEALQQLEALHQRSPSHMTCLALAKVRTRQAVDVALKQEGDDKAQEAAVVPLLHEALRFAAEGVAVHRSPNCLSLCDTLINILVGRRVTPERLEVLERLQESLPGRKEALTFGWVDPSAESVPIDKWPLEAGEGVNAATHLQRRLGPFLEKLRGCIGTDTRQYMRAAGSSELHLIGMTKVAQEHADMPVHIRLFRVAGLPAKLVEPLHRKWMERQGSGEQERRRRQLEEQAGEAERQRAVKRLEIASRKRAATLPDLQKRVDKVRDFLLRRMAAATGRQAGGSDGEEQRKRRLGELLQQTEVSPQQLQELLSRAQLPAAQWKAVQRSMGLAEQRQGVCYDLPQQGGEALAAAATTSERAQLSAASLDGERFAATLHQLVWHNPKFAEGQAAAVHQAAKELKQLDKMALSSLFGEELGFARDRNVPDPQSVEVWPECPGDLQELLPHGADAAAAAGDGLCVSELAVGAAASSASLARMYKREQARSSPPSSPEDSPRASAMAELDSVDDELPPLVAPASLPADRQQSLPSLDPAEDPDADDDLLLRLHVQHERYRKMHFMHGLLIGQEGSEELRCRVLADALNEPAAMQAQADLYLRRSLLGLELLHLLERRAAAGAAAACDAHGEDGDGLPTVEQLELCARWDTLDHSWQTEPAAKLAEQLAQPGELGQLKQLLEALHGGLQGCSEPLAAVALSACLLQLRLRQGAAAARQAAADPSGSQHEASLAGYLREVRERLTRGVLAGLQALTSTRRLVPSLFQAVCEFMHFSLVEAGGGRRDEHEIRSGVALSYLGRLPLRRLLQLHAFLALRIVDTVAAPKELDRELQEVALAACQSATRTQQGCIRLSEGGLEAVAHDVAVLEALRANKVGTADEVAAPDMYDPAVAAEQLASYCCGLPHATAEVAVMARGEEPSTVEQTLQKVEGYPAMDCVALLQRTVYTRRVLTVMQSGILSDPVETGEKLLEAMAGVLDKLKQLSGVNGGVLVDAHVRRQVADALSFLLERLPVAVGKVCDALSLTQPAKSALDAAVVSFKLAVLGKHRQQLQAEQLRGNRDAAEQLQRLTLKLEMLANEEKFQAADEMIASTMIQMLKDEAREKHVLLRNAAQQLSGPLHAGSMYSQAALLGTTLDRLAEQFAKALGLLQRLLLTVVLLSEVALERGRALEGQLLCSFCMQPSLSPVFTALSRHLLALKWQDDMAAEEAAEAEQQEARRQALLEELLNEDESSQAKDDKAKEKRRAKKAAKKERRAAAADAAAKEAAAARVGGVAPQRLESLEQRRQEEQVEGFARMMQQLEQDAAAAGEAQEERQQGQQAQRAQQARQPVERHPSTSEYYDAAIQAEEEEWGTPLSSPMPDALEAPPEGAELVADVPAAPASPRPQQVAAAASSASSAEAPPGVAAADHQPQRSKVPDQPQQAQREQEQPQEAEPWETAGGKRRGKRGAAGKPDAPRQQAAAAPVPAQPAMPAATVQAGQQAASRPVGPAPTQQQQQQQQQQAADTRPPTEPAEAHKASGGRPAALPQAADAAPASPPAATPREDDGWEEAPVQRRRGGKHSAAAKPAAAAAAPAAPVRHYQRIINWAGDWICECGQRNAARSRCYTCNQADSPCREYCFQGGCSRGGSPPDGSCKFSHPPFELPSARRPPTKKGPHQHSRQPVDLIADGSRDDGKPCMLPPPGVPLVAGQAATAPVSGASVRRLAAAQQQGGAAAGRSPVTPQGLLSPSSAGRLPSNAMPPGSQLRGWGPAAAAPAAKAAAGAAAATASPRQEGPSQRRAATWQAAPQSPTAAGTSAAAAAAAPHQDEDELAGLLDMMGIGEANGTDSAAPAPAARSWGEPSSWAHQVGSSHELEGVDQAPGSWPAPGQDVEEAELAAAIQASLADAAATASRHQAGAWQELPATAPARSSGAAAAAESSDSEALALAGLRNEAGEYNCFLNVVVQCLWRCAEFRQQVAGWDAAFCAHDPVLAALHGLFAQLEQQEAARSSAAAHGTSGSLPPVDPAPLREALAALPGQGFSLGEMNDAAELLLCVYEKVMEAEGAGGRGAELAATFGLAVREEVHCAACGKTTHQNAYTQYFYNTQATTLQMAQLVAEGAASMGALLRDAEAQHRKSCDTDMSGCGVLNSVNHFLQAAPRVFTLQVAWETHAPAPDVVASTLAALDETLDLGEVYQGVDRGLHCYALRSMVCYYGQHYQALVLVPEAGGWLMFDDTRVSRVGSWADVRRKCEAGRIQPSVLFYEAV